MKTKILIVTLVLVVSFVLGAGADEELPEASEVKKPWEMTREEYSSKASIKLARGTLEGLPGVMVVVEVIRQYDGDEGPVESTLQTDVELKLRKAGIRVFDTLEEAFEAGQCSPVLSLTVWIMKITTLEPFVGSSAYAYHIELELLQNGALFCAPGVILCRTWKTGGGIGYSHPPYTADLSEHVRDVIRDSVDQFINDYLAANPKQAEKFEEKDKPEGGVDPSE